MEKEPEIAFFIKRNTIGINIGWNSIQEIWGLFVSKKLNLKDPLLSQVNFYVPLRGGGGFSGLEFVNLENSKTKIIRIF